MTLLSKLYIKALKIILRTGALEYDNHQNCDVHVHEKIQNNTLNICRVMTFSTILHFSNLYIYLHVLMVEVFGL